MGLFDSISSLVGGALGADASSAIGGQVMDVLQQHGINGADGLVSQLQQSGLGEHVASWVSSDAQNLPVSPEQLESALGAPAIASLAQKFGVDPSQASQLLSQHLPGILGQMVSGGGTSAT
jgi:uncharacterized protein YidB (DUF937 family)